MTPTDTLLVELLNAKSITLQGDSEQQLNSLRVMLYRKLQAHISQWDAVGYLKDELRDATISMALDRSTNAAKFTIVKRKPPVSFKILKVEPHDKEVPADLGQYQEGTIQHGSADQDSQEHGTYADPSCSQGESDGQCSPEEDWQSKLREFIESDSDGSTGS